MSKITIDEYQAGVLRTWNPEIQGEDQITAAVFGLVGETGEMVELLKKFRYHNHGLDVEKVKKELGDCAFYWAMLCNAFKFQASDVLQLNADKLRARYPNGFETQRSLNKDESKEAAAKS